MKTIRISDETHRKLTATLGTLMAQTGKPQTYQDAVEALVTQSVKLPKETLTEVENFIKNKHLGYKTREEFIAEAIRFFLKWESEDYEYIKIPKEKYDKLNKAVKQMSTPYYNAEEFISDQIDKILDQYEKWLKEKGED